MGDGRDQFATAQSGCFGEDRGTDLAGDIGKRIAVKEKERSFAMQTFRKSISSKNVTSCSR